MRVGLLWLFVLLSACNTVAGVGQDITTGADTVSDWFR